MGTISRFRATTSGVLVAVMLLAGAIPVVAHDEDDLERIDATTLPVAFPFASILSHVVVDVGVGGDPPAPFMFDTGAPTFVSSTLAQAHGGAVLDEVRIMAGGDTIISNPLQVVDSMRVGGAVEISQARVLSPWAPTDSLYCVSPNGLLGSNVLADAVWQIDYSTEQMTVAASIDHLDHIEDALALPFTPQDGLSPTPFVTLPVGDGELTFIVDTGAGIPVAISAGALASVGVAVPADAPTAVSLASGAAGSFETTITFMDVPIRFGDTQIVTPILVADGMAPLADGNIGHDFLKNFVVTFDWSSNTVYLDPLAEDGSIRPLDDPAAARVGWQDGQVVVVSVASGGPADVAGLELGQGVASIDGQSTADFSIDDFCSILLDGSHATLTTEDGRAYDIGPVEGFFDPRDR